jgi:hypothetical protein
MVVLFVDLDFLVPILFTFLPIDVALTIIKPQFPRLDHRPCVIMTLSVVGWTFLFRSTQLAIRISFSGSIAIVVWVANASQRLVVSHLAAAAVGCLDWMFSEDVAASEVLFEFQRETENRGGILDETHDRRSRWDSHSWAKGLVEPQKWRRNCPNDRRIHRLKKARSTALMVTKGGSMPTSK